MKDEYGNEILGKNTIVNPGIWVVPNATEKHARQNMAQFIADCKCGGLWYERTPNDDPGGGRFAFALHRHGYDHVFQIDMPGWPLEQVRCQSGDNVWEFPRLYVDGSSWLWMFALCTDEEWKETLDFDD